MGLLYLYLYLFNFTGKRDDFIVADLSENTVISFHGQQKFIFPKETYVHLEKDMWWKEATSLVPTFYGFHFPVTSTYGRRSFLFLGLF